jgi:hypothetical protein
MCLEDQFGELSAVLVTGTQLGYRTLILGEARKLTTEKTGHLWPLTRRTTGYQDLRHQLCRPYGTKELKWVRHGERQKGERAQLRASQWRPELLMPERSSLSDGLNSGLAAVDLAGCRLQAAREAPDTRREVPCVTIQATSEVGATAIYSSRSSWNTDFHSFA